SVERPPHAWRKREEWNDLLPGRAPGGPGAVGLARWWLSSAPMARSGSAFLNRRVASSTSPAVNRRLGANWSITASDPGGRTVAPPEPAYRPHRPNRTFLPSLPHPPPQPNLPIAPPHPPHRPNPLGLLLPSVRPGTH